MDDYHFFDEIVIPRREEIGARLSFEYARVSVRFFSGSSRRVRPSEIRDACLSKLARAVRGDGSISVGDCLDFLSEWESSEGEDRPSVTIENEVYNLTPVEPPESMVFNFIFNGDDVLTPLIQAEEELYFYDGEGVFVSECGDFFNLPEARVIDPYLSRDRDIPAMAFSMFYRRAYPILEKEERFRLYSSLQMVSRPPLRVASRITEEGKLAVNMNWCVPYPEIRFFPNAGMICECRGELRQSVPALGALPRAMQGDGEFFPDRTQYSLLLRLSRAFPEGFASPLPAYPAPVMPERKPTFAEMPIPEKTVREKTTITLPGGVTVQKTPSPPVFNNRGAILTRFIRTYGDVEGEPMTIVSFSAFSPDWSMMNENQRKSYFYLRSCYEKGEKAPHAGYAYLLLLIYEALNRPGKLDFLFRLWEANREEFRRLDMLMPALLRDYIAIRAPETPLTEIHRRVNFDLSAVAHPELYLDLTSEEGLRSLSPALLTAMTGYDVTKSKFYRPDNASVLYEAFLRAILAADKFHRAEGEKGLFESFHQREFVIHTTACSSSVMTADSSFDLLYRFTTCFYDPALREELGLLMKAAENELRIREGVSGRLRTAGLKPALLEAVRESFREKKKPVRVEVDISSALSIEKASWETTDRLIAEAGLTENFEEEEEPVTEEPIFEEEKPEEPLSPYEALLESLSEAANGYLLLVAEGASEDKKIAYASSHAAMPETLEEEINEKASELTGDILIENGEIIEDYRAELPI